MKLGLYGGAFNPLHRCHLLAAEAATNRLGLDRLLFIPTGDPPHKPRTDFIPAADRLAMVRLAIAPYPAFEVSDIEISRPSKSSTVATVRGLRRTGPDSRRGFLIGLDAFLEFPTCRDPDALLGLCEFAVVSRPGSRFRSLADIAMLGLKKTEGLARLDEGRSELEEFPLADGRPLWGLAIDPCEVSSQEIRKRLRSRQSLENLLPEVVESYILRHNLFAGGAP